MVHGEEMAKTRAWDSKFIAWLPGELSLALYGIQKCPAGDDNLKLILLKLYDLKPTDLTYGGGCVAPDIDRVISGELSIMDAIERRINAMHDETKDLYFERNRMILEKYR